MNIHITFNDLLNPILFQINSNANFHSTLKNYVTIMMQNIEQVGLICKVEKYVSNMIEPSTWNIP